jgi:hypothetical protein
MLRAVGIAQLLAQGERPVQPRRVINAPAAVPAWEQIRVSFAKSEFPSINIGAEHSSLVLDCSVSESLQSFEIWLYPAGWEKSRPRL